MEALKKHLEKTHQQKRKKIAVEIAPNATEEELDAIMAEYDRINMVHCAYPCNRFGRTIKVEVRYV